MKNKLISLLQELLIEIDRANLIGIKLSIMENTAFLGHPKDFGEITNIMNAVNSYIESSNDNTKANLEEVIKRINSKY